MTHNVFYTISHLFLGISILAAIFYAIKHRKTSNLFEKFTYILLLPSVYLLEIFTKGFLYDISISLFSIALLLILLNYILKPLNYDLKKLNGAKKFSSILIIIFCLFLGFGRFLPTFILPFILIGGPILLPVFLIVIYIKCMKNEK